MATKAHCVYCFETLSARLQKRTALSFSEVESLWSEYVSQDKLQAEGPGGGTPKLPIKFLAEDSEDNDDDGEEAGEAGEEEEVQHRHNLRPRQISNIQTSSPASSSTSSTPSNSSSQTLTSEGSKASSKSFSSSSSTISFSKKEEEYPLFVTWNTVDNYKDKSLRGCIGTFEAQRLSQGLREYALISALNDTRFSPISISELPSLSCDITLLLNFTPCQNPLDWELGTHGIRISFMAHNRRYGSTYLPQVALEQGWTKEETVVSLMRKAGWSGRSSDWRRVTGMKCTRYEGKKADLDCHTFSSWRAWVDRTRQGGLGS